MLERVVINVDFQSLLGMDLKQEVLGALRGAPLPINTIFEQIPPPPSIDLSTKISFTNDIFLNNTYNSKKAIVKRVPYQEIQEIQEMINEVVIHALFYELTKNNIMRAPKALALFKDDKHFYFFQEQVNGKYVHELGDEMLDCLLTISEQLQYLAQYNFVHKDFKSDNVLYHMGTIYVIDFGFSCIAKIGEQPCTNRSADLCFLILSIYLNLGRAPKPIFIKRLVNDISRQLSKSMPEDCDISEEQDCVCFQDAIYEHPQMDMFLPQQIHEILKTYKHTLKF